ncbi:hypothetical protein LWI29_023992 [Acer saccharum]|uniref:Protein kinase domain-containing protein n=1 Tax=Acer saccharum TaxID=4024 RepID=A0AA39SWV7_ACESA|nr:hypothetical protein LWI29_023992 [Acer saccharum]
MLSSMTDALMCEYEGFDTAQDMWIALKDKFGGTSTTKLRRLTIKFDTYRKRQNHDMRQHLREMSNMIRELKSAGHTLTDEQQIQAMIRSLPNSWENMKINMTHNDNIKTFDDISRHVELEDERLEAAKASDSKSNLLLDWNTRFNICLAIAEALKYLHEDSRLKIVHRNIKPSNILLDKELNAKVSDFGLAKIYEDENLNVAIGAGDTLVYMAPEYATVKVVTEKADVYSYGIVLLEIVSGKRDADFKSDQETVYLIDKACLLHSKGKLVNLIDEKLLTYNRDQALTILDIAILCIDRSPSRRPTMSGVCDIGFKRGAYIVEMSLALDVSGLLQRPEIEPISGWIPQSLGNLSSLQYLMGGDGCRRKMCWPGFRCSEVGRQAVDGLSDAALVAAGALVDEAEMAWLETGRPAGSWHAVVAVSTVREGAAAGGSCEG